MRRRCTFILTTILALAACGGEPKNEDTATVNAYLESLPSWPDAPPDAETPAGDPVSLDEVEDGVLYTCTETPYDITHTPEKLVTMNPGADNFWPGVLIQGKSYAEGRGSFVELPIRSRAPLRLSIDLLFGDNSRTIENPDLASAQAAIGEIIEAAHNAELEPQSSVNFNQVTSHSVEQTAIALGLSARYLSFEARARLQASRLAHRTTVTASFAQRAFTVSVVPPETPGAFFSDAFTAADLEAQRALGRIGPDNLPVYLASIAYGRILLFSFTAEGSATEISGTLNVMAQTAVAGGSVELSARQRQLLESAELSVFTMGGDDDAALALIRTGDLSSYFAEDTAITGFAPISYVLRNLGDNSIAKVTDTSSYTVKECKASTADQVPTNGLLVEYRFNENVRIPGNPGRTPNSAPTGSSLDGVIHDDCRVAATADRFGLADRAYDFFGRGSCDAAAPSLIYTEAVGYTDTLTFAVWLTRGVNGGFIVGQPGGAFISMDAGGLVSVEVEGERVLSDASAIEDGAWKFFALTAEREGSDTRLALSRDGLVVAETVIAGALSNSRNASTLIGNASGGEGVPYPGRTRDFQGKLDDVRIYDRALTADEIAVLFAEGADR